MDSMKGVMASLDGLIARTEAAVAAAAPPAKPAVDGAGGPVPAGGGDGQVPKKKKKKEKKKKAPPVSAVPASVTQFLQCDLRAGVVCSVALHPEADALYVLSVDVGDAEPRSVCAGLRGHVAEDELAGRSVVAICNLKPRTLRGVPSQAMLLAGSVVSPDSGAKERVVALYPPPGATPGDVVAVAGMAGERTVADGKFVSGKNWDRVVPRLKVKNAVATYEGEPLVIAGESVACDLPDGAEIH